MGYIDSSTRENRRDPKWRFSLAPKSVFGRKGENVGQRIATARNIALDMTVTPYWLKLIPLGQRATQVQQRVGMEQARRSLRWCGFISLSSYWLPARTPILNLLILPVYMPVAPSVFRKEVGEEGVEVALAATSGDKAELVCESADLIYHLMVLLQDQGLSMNDMVNKLKSAINYKPLFRLIEHAKTNKSPVNNHVYRAF